MVPRAGNCPRHGKLPKSDRVDCIVCCSGRPPKFHGSSAAIGFIGRNVCALSCKIRAAAQSIAQAVGTARGMAKRDGHHMCTYCIFLLARDDDYEAFLALAVRVGSTPILPQAQLLITINDRSG